MLPTTNLISGLAVYRRAYLKQPLTFLNGDMCVDLRRLEKAATKHADMTSSRQVRISEETISTDPLKSVLNISNDGNVSHDHVELPSQNIWHTRFASETTECETSWAETNPDYYATIYFDEPTRNRIRQANMLIRKNTRISLKLFKSKVYLVHSANWGSGRCLLSSSHVKIDQWQFPLTTQTFREVFKTQKPSQVEIYAAAVDVPIPTKVTSYNVYRKGNCTFMRVFIETLVAKYEFWYLPQFKQYGCILRQ
jgi:hypothetical protein